MSYLFAPTPGHVYSTPICDQRPWPPESGALSPNRAEAMKHRPAESEVNALADTIRTEARADTPHIITRRAVVGWVLYDLANTIFSMGVVSLFFSLWVRESVGVKKADADYGMISGVSMAIIF